MRLTTEKNKLTPVLSSFISYIYTFVFEKPQVLFKKKIVKTNKKDKTVLDELGLTEDDISEEVFY